MQIKQFEHKNLSHFSYAILSDCEKEVILIDPSRNSEQYIQFAKDNEATIIGVIETHPHADFISSHLELHDELGATIYASKLVEASYPHQSFNEGQQIKFGKIILSALDTPGHSPDSICVVLEHEGKAKAVFTGDTLFIGDCGRPDLRPGNSDAKAAAEKLAAQMFYSLRKKLMPLSDETIVYPAHGAGTLCGKALSKANSSTIGYEKKTNWSLKNQTEDEFVKELLSDQPFVPAYFSFDVELNKKGAAPFQQNIDAVKMIESITNEAAAEALNHKYWIIDIRKSDAFKNGHLHHSINLMDETKFETWLGSIIKPHEKFYIGADDEDSLIKAIERTASIGYETQIESSFVIDYTQTKEEKINVEEFKNHPDNYTTIDVRNKSEVKEKKPFKNSLSIPLGELRENVDKIPVDKQIVVHCASGYRSAAGSSLLQSILRNKVKVFDLSDAVKQFM